MEIDWIKKRWGGKLILKGILDSEDAIIASNTGADAIIVSNHGGRQLDGAPSSIQVLPEIVDAVGSKIEVHIDGALTRIADSSDTITLNGEEDLLLITIKHNDLLSNNMLVNGHIEIVDTAGNTWFVEIELTAESEGLKSINDFIGPGQMISLALLFAALWVYLTMRESAAKTSKPDDDEIKTTVTAEEILLDAWGRPLDD